MRMPILAVALALLSSVALAQAVPANGEVTKVDAAQSKITLKHGPIKNLDMDSMTMVFVVADPAMLKTVKPGDRVVFEAERVNGRITVTKMRKAP
ncbi:MAG: copper-binding protein [Alphaproteobacteria bacterium]|nr:copper-binding protein [Alphaproteobacteria bacterium]MCW5741360.1 copper-binding protein [Alphaproteobacteria bacterium]